MTLLHVVQPQAWSRDRLKRWSSENDPKEDRPLPVVRSRFEERRLSTAETAELASQKVLDKPDIFPVQEEECADRIKYRTKNVACTLR